MARSKIILRGVVKDMHDASNRIAHNPLFRIGGELHPDVRFMCDIAWYWFNRSRRRKGGC
jgi:hypothetical protein